MKNYPRDHLNMMTWRTKADSHDIFTFLLDVRPLRFHGFLATANKDTRVADSVATLSDTDAMGHC